MIGAGAIGGYTGGQLAHNGFDVTLIDPWPEHIETIRRDGLTLDDALHGPTPQQSLTGNDTSFFVCKGNQRMPHCAPLLTHIIDWRWSLRARPHGAPS